MLFIQLGPFPAMKKLSPAGYFPLAGVLSCKFIATFAPSNIKP